MNRSYQEPGMQLPLGVSDPAPLSIALRSRSTGCRAANRIAAEVVVGRRASPRTFLRAMMPGRNPVTRSRGFDRSPATRPIVGVILLAVVATAQGWPSSCPPQPRRLAADMNIPQCFSASYHRKQPPRSRLAPFPRYRSPLHSGCFKTRILDQLALGIDLRILPMRNSMSVDD